MLKTLRIACVLLAAMTLLTGIVYPFAITGIAQVAFHHPANGSRIVRDGNVVGSEWIGQPFAGERYFWGRPSATTPFPYNAGSSTGSNLGPTNPDFLKAVAERALAMRKAHPDQKGPVPGDLVTASASGLDPHISPAAAQYQAGRVAQARSLPLDDIRARIERHTEGRLLGLLGEPRVNVVKLNLELDAAR